MKALRPLPAMNKGLLSALSIILLCAPACSTALRTGIAEAAAPSSNRLTRILIANAHDLSMDLPGVSVFLIQSNGEKRQIGITNEYGSMAVSKSLLDPEKSVALVICHPSFFCGAILLESTDLRAFDEYFVTLSPVAVR